MPVWVSIATMGGSSIREKLIAVESERFIAGSEVVETIGPRTRDYWISISFILFGLISAIAGVTSNIYVNLL